MADAAEAPLPPPGPQVVCTLISPVKRLHKEWVKTHVQVKRRGTILEEVGHQECLAFFQELLDSLPPDGKCTDLEHPTTLVKCTCLSGLKNSITKQEKSVTATFLHLFAKMDWHG